MRLHSLLIASAIATVLALPAMAQQSATITSLCILFQIYGPSDQSDARQTAGPRGCPLKGGRGNFPMGGEFDGMIIQQVPSDAAPEVGGFYARAARGVAKTMTDPIILSSEFKTLMEKAKQGAASYAPPGR
jgi:hypothetical protein